MKRQFFKISLIILVLLGLVIPNLPLDRTESKVSASESETTQEPLPEPFPMFQNNPEYWWYQFFNYQTQEGNPIQGIDPFSPNSPWNNLQPEIEPDGTVRFKPNEAKPSSSNSTSSSISTLESSTTEDLEPPQLLEFDFSPKSINTNIGSQTVISTLRMTDNLSGNRFAWVNFRSPSGQQWRGSSVWEPYHRISGNALDGVYQTSIEFPQYSEAGTWHIFDIGLADKVGNYRYFYEQDLINLGFPTKLENGKKPWSFAIITDLHIGFGDSNKDYGDLGWNDNTSEIGRAHV